MKRLFTFGCSFTNYCWPTWADFMSLDYDEYYNLGQGGGGNQFIFEQVIEAAVTHKFTSDDTIIIMWTGYHRHDLYKDNCWHTPGNVLNAEPLYGKEYLDKYFDVKGSVLHSLNYIYAAQQFLTNQNCHWHMTSMQSMTVTVGEIGGVWTKLARTFINTSLFTDFPELEKYRFVFDHDCWLSVSMREFMENSRYSLDDYGRTLDGDGPLSHTDGHATPQMNLDWCNHVGLAVNNKSAQEVMDNWELVWGHRPMHRKEGRLWCKENIPSVRRN